MSQGENQGMFHFPVSVGNDDTDDTAGEFARYSDAVGSLKQECELSRAYLNRDHKYGLGSQEPGVTSCYNRLSDVYGIFVFIYPCV